MTNEDLLPSLEAAVEESEADRRKREALRLEVAPSRPGDDPPTYGDEGGGNLYPDSSRSTPQGSRLFLRRMGRLAGSLRRRFHRPLLRI